MGTGLTPTRIETYRQAGPTVLQMHLFLPDATGGTRPHSAAVFFFGGGWEGGTPHQFYDLCAELARRGAVAMAAEYRVRSHHGVGPAECVADAKAAVRWLRRQAGRFGFTPDRIAAGGGSAGGHLALCCALLDGFNAPEDELTVSPIPDALVLYNPVVDTTPAGFGCDRCGPDPRRLSPMQHIRGGAPPTIMFHGSADRVVPYENVERFTRHMKEAGNHCRLVTFTGEDHGFFNYGHKSGAYPEVVRMTIDFFAEHGFLPAGTA